MNDVVKAPLLGLIAAAFTAAAGLSSESVPVPRVAMMGAGSFFCVTLLAAWLLKNAATLAEETVANARQEKVRVERDFAKLRTSFEELKKKQVDTSTLMMGLQSIAQLTSQSLDFESLLELVIEITQRFVGAKKCSLWLIDFASGAVRLERSFGWTEAERAVCSVELGRGVIGHVLEHKVLLDCESMKREPATMALARETRPASMICAPLIVAGEVLGALNIEEFTDTHKTSIQDDIRLMVFLGTVAATGLKNARMFQGAQDRANTDGLTRLHNHRYFQDQLDREVKRSDRYGDICSLILTDIDHFKKFNDTYGHQIGDLVLRETAACIQAAGLDPNATIARYGGEEFVVVLPGANKAVAARAAEHVRLAVEGREYSTDAGPLKVTVSLGVATYPDDARAKAQLIEAADAALYQAKKAGRNRVRLAGADGADPAANQPAAGRPS